MIRKIIKIDEEKCTGCGLCATACHEGAIDIIDGKAKLMREHFCDGLGDCLPACPTNAITFEEREAPEYDEEAVMNAKKAMSEKSLGAFSGCPGTMMRQMQQNSIDETISTKDTLHSKLTNWPVQIKLAPTKAPYFENAKLLIAADCTAYAYANLHQDYIKGKVCLIGCPKLDMIDYSEKLTEIIKYNDVQSVTVVRMEVPCCGGLENAVKKSIQDSGKFIPLQVDVISIAGNVL